MAKYNNIEDSNLNKTVFYGSLMVLMLFTLPLLVFPDWSAEKLSALNSFIDDNFGYLYQWLAIFVLGFAFWMAFSKRGKITLGKTRPAFSTYSWAIRDITAMLISNGLKHRIAATFPLSASASAHEAIERGNQYGCVVQRCSIAMT